MNVNASTSFAVEQQQGGNRNKIHPKSDKTSSSSIAAFHFLFIREKKRVKKKRRNLLVRYSVCNGFKESIFQAELKTWSESLKSDKIEILLARCNKFWEKSSLEFRFRNVILESFYNPYTLDKEARVPLEKYFR